MNISASNGLYLPPASSLSTSGASARLKADRAAEQVAQPPTTMPLAPTGEKRQLDKNLAATLSMMQGEKVRGRLADNPAQNPAARRALAEYTANEDQERREELKALGVDVYA